jgi:hypothetical protein
MILKLENQLKMISDIIYDRKWIFKYSILNRKCYFSGQSLQFQPCYLGRKKLVQCYQKDIKMMIFG